MGDGEFQRIVGLVTDKLGEVSGVTWTVKAGKIEDFSNVIHVDFTNKESDED